MRIIVDTNIFFSLLLYRNYKLREILQNIKYDFYSPNFSILELFKHKEKIFKYTSATENEVYEYFDSILQRIHFINTDIIGTKNREKALQLCSDIDEKDAPFIALALELDGFVWTGDKKLKESLKAKDFDRFFEY
jgi:predicted nucleic acid-binding protein